MSSDRPLRVLVVDDHAAFGDSLKTVLESIGCAVDTAETPYAAITLSDSTHYDLALVDYRMPQMDGLEVLRCMAERGHRCLLLVTGFIHELDEQRARDVGAAAVLQKPLDVARLVRIARYLYRNGDREVRELPTTLCRRVLCRRVLRPVALPG